MRVSDFILARLAEEGITHAAVVYGGAISELMDAFLRQDRIKYVVMQHEQACAFFAEGYSQVKGVPGLAIATSGPGGQNMITGIANCFYNSVPAIFITGQVSTKFRVQRGSGMRQLGFQETDMLGIAGPVTKLAITLEAPYEAGEAESALERLLSVCREGRQGPAVLDLPIDAQRAESKPCGPPGSPNPYPPCAEAARSYLDSLAGAKRPGILVGGGARRWGAEILAFAELHNLPVFRTWNALDVVTDDSPVYAGTVGTYGGPGRNFGVQNCDLLLVLGSRMSGRILGGMPQTFAREAKIYRVDVDEPGLLHAERRADVNVHAELGDFVKKLSEQARPEQLGRFFAVNWLQRCREWVERYDPVRPEHLAAWHHYGFVRRLSEALPADATVVYDTGGNAIMMGHCFRSKKGQRIFSSNANTPMGFAMCGAIGAWFADPSRPVYCLIGDGGMQLNIQELQTLVHYGANVKVFILNNKVLANTLLYQLQNAQQVVACTPESGYSSPDFVAVAKAYGLPAFTIDNFWDDQNQSKQSNTMEEILPMVLGHEGPMVIDVVHKNFCDFKPRMTLWNAAIEEMYPPLSQEEFKTNMIVEPLDGWRDHPKQYKDIPDAYKG